MTNSPRCVNRDASGPQASATVFTGAPSKRLRKHSLQPGNVPPLADARETSKPQFEGASGAMPAPARVNHSVHAPSEPSCGQLAPPSANTTHIARTSAGPTGVFISSDHPPPSSAAILQHRCRVWNRRRAQPVQPGAQQGRRFHVAREDAARTADEGLDAEAARPVAHRHRAERFQQRCNLALAFVEAADKGRKRFTVRQVQPALAGKQKLAPDRRHRVEDADLHARAGEHVGGHQPGRAAADDGNRGRERGINGHASWGGAETEVGAAGCAAAQCAAPVRKIVHAAATHVDPQRPGDTDAQALCPTTPVVRD